MERYVDVGLGLERVPVDQFLHLFSSFQCDHSSLSESVAGIGRPVAVLKAAVDWNLNGRGLERRGALA